MMRSVCFVDRLELDFTGNHFSHAVALADADNDGVCVYLCLGCFVMMTTLFLLQLNELVIGNVDGILALFKGDMSSKPWKKCSGLGTVRSLTYISYKFQWDMGRPFLHRIKALLTQTYFTIFPEIRSPCVFSHRVYL